jgi:hypothetical protein
VLSVKASFVEHEPAGFIVGRAEKEEMVHCVVVHAAAWAGGRFGFLETVEVLGKGGVSGPELEEDGGMFPG